MKQEPITQSIKKQLDGGCARLDRRIAERLETARRQALAHYPKQVAQRVTGLAVVDGWLDSHNLHPRAWSVWLSGTALLLALGGSIYWYQLDQQDDDIDVVLLADDLPLHAYVDNRFEQWLEH